MNKKILVSVLLSLFVSVFLCVASADGLPKHCSLNCTVSFGEMLGESVSGVKAFSNCNNTCVNPEPNFIDQTFTGIKWQCVEYARRWLLANENVVYGDVDIAADIWQLDSVTSADKKLQKLFISILNGNAEHGLQRGDLLIYSRAFYGTGHVAVVLKIDENEQRIYLGEQNFDNELWESGYAREIPYIMREGAIWLLDPYLIGWKRVVSE